MPNILYQFAGQDAANYEKYLGPLLFEPSAQMLKAQLTFKAVQTVLEISSGTGRATRHIRRIFPATTTIVATDINADMLGLARAKLKTPHIAFVTADAQDLPFPDTSFDLVICQYGLMFFQDKSKALKEIFRVLKPGGHFVFSTWDKTENMPVLKIIFNDNIIASLGVDNSKQILTPFSLHDKQILSDLLSNAGFSSIQVHNEKFNSPVASAQVLVKAFLLKHTVRREVEKKDGDAVSLISTKILEQLKLRFGPKPFSFNLSAWIGIGSK